MTEPERRNLNQIYDEHTVRIEENRRLVEDSTRPHDLWDDDARYLKDLVAIHTAIGHEVMGQLALFELPEEGVA